MYLRASKLQILLLLSLAFFIFPIPLLSPQLKILYRSIFITIHTISKKKLNYKTEHYTAIARMSHAFRDEKIMDRAKENLEIIGRIYGYE